MIAVARSGSRFSQPKTVTLNVRLDAGRLMKSYEAFGAYGVAANPIWRVERSQSFVG